MAMLAVSEDNDITFKNVLGGIKFQLCGTQKVKSIKLEGNNNEKLSVAATVTVYTDDTKPSIVMSSDGSIGTNRGFSGNYWSSGTYSNGAYYLSFYDFNPTVEMYYSSRAFGISVRCVQVTDEVAEL